MIATDFLSDMRGASFEFSIVGAGARCMRAKDWIRYKTEKTPLQMILSNFLLRHSISRASQKRVASGRLLLRQRQPWVSAQWQLYDQFWPLWRPLYEA